GSETEEGRGETEKGRDETEEGGGGRDEAHDTRPLHVCRSEPAGDIRRGRCLAYSTRHDDCERDPGHVAIDECHASRLLAARRLPGRGGSHGRRDLPCSGLELVGIFD